MFFCDAEYGLEVVGRTAYAYEMRGNWVRIGKRYSLPMSEKQASAVVYRHLCRAGAPTRAEALSALTGRHHAASEA